MTGKPIGSEADAAAACRALHARGPHTVVITSMSFEPVGAPPSPHLLMLASRQEPGGAIRQWRLRLPRIDQDFTGTGDLTAALLMAWMHRMPGADQLPEVLERVGAGLQAVLGKTIALGRSEIALIQSQDALRAPAVQHRAEEVLAS